MAVTALSKKVEAQIWSVGSRDVNNISKDQYKKSQMGTLIISDMPDRNYRRLTLTGAVAYKSLFKQMTAAFRGFNEPSLENAVRIGMNYSGDPLCHFDFSEEEIRSGKKYIEYQIIVTDEDEMLFGLYCRDYEARQGRRYMFSEPDDIYAFATELGIKEAVIRDGVGKKMNTLELELVKNPISNLGSLLMIHAAARGEI